MVNKAAKSKTYRAAKERREERANRKKCLYRPLSMFVKDKKTGKRERPTITFPVPLSWATPLNLHSFKGQKLIKPSKICGQAHYDSDTCDCCESEGNFGPNWPQLFKVIPVFVHNYVGRNFRKNGKRHPWNPIRLAMIPEGKDQEAWEKLEAIERKCKERGISLGKLVFQFKQPKGAGSFEILDFPKEDFESLPTEGVIPKEFRLIFKKWDEDFVCQHSLNAFQNANFEHWGVEEPEVKNVDNDEEDADDSYPDEDDEDDEYDHDEDEDDDEPRRKTKSSSSRASKSKPSTKSTKRRRDEDDDEDEDDDDEDEEDDEPKRRKPAAKSKTASKSVKSKPKASSSKRRSRDEDDDEDDEEGHWSDSEEEDEDDDEPRSKKKPVRKSSPAKKKPSAKKAKRRDEDDDEDEDDLDDDFDLDDDSDDDDEDDD